MPKMEHPLDGARLKLGRAKRHLGGLLQAVKRFGSGSPYEIVGAVETREGGNYYVVRFREHRAIPSSFGLIAGDVCNNLRAALDHALWQLHVAFNERGLGEKDRFNFPIVESAESFRADGMAHGGLQHLPHGKWRLVEESQPYNTGRDDLSLLARLNNSDKHRIIPVIAVGVVVQELDLSGIDVVVPPGETRELVRMMAPFKPITDGSEIARVAVGDAGAAGNVRARPKVGVNFSFPDEPGIGGKPRLLAVTLAGLV